MFKTSSKQRLSIGQILNDPMIKAQAIQYVNSDTFKTQFIESRQKMNIMKEESNELFKVK